jgi:hypothetical protein
MLKKLAIILIVFSLIVPVSAGNICIDSYWGQVAAYHITDLTTGDLIWKQNVAAGDAHNKNIDDTHIGHKLLITCDFYTGYGSWSD